MAKVATARAFDPARSRVVLVGTGSYLDPAFPDIPQVDADLSDLASTFTDPDLGGLRPENCYVAPSDATLNDLGHSMRSAVNEAEDLLLFYYAGHGLIDSQGQLRLALHSTTRRSAELNSLSFNTVRNMMARSRAAHRMVILDCCFSGRAVADRMGIPAAATIADDSMGAGMLTLTSTTKHSSMVNPGERHTAFTGRLLSVLREGTGEPHRELTMVEVYRRLSTRLAADGLPAPGWRSTRDTARLALLRAPQATTSTLVNSPAFSEQISGLLSSQSPRLRQAGVNALGDWLADPDPGRALTARRALGVVAASDVPSIADSARKALATAGTAGPVVKSTVDPLALVCSAAMTSVDGPDRAERLALGVPDPALQALALVVVAVAFIGTDLSRAAHLLVRASDVAATIASAARRADTMVEITKALQFRGHGLPLPGPLLEQENDGAGDDEVSASANGSPPPEAVPEDRCVVRAQLGVDLPLAAGRTAPMFVRLEAGLRHPWAQDSSLRPDLRIVAVPLDNADIEPAEQIYRHTHPAVFMFQPREAGIHQVRLSVYANRTGTALQQLVCEIPVASGPLRHILPEQGSHHEG